MKLVDRYLDDFKKLLKLVTKRKPLKKPTEGWTGLGKDRIFYVWGYSTILHEMIDEIIEQREYVRDFSSKECLKEEINKKVLLYKKAPPTNIDNALRNDFKSLMNQIKNNKRKWLIPIPISNLIVRHNLKVGPVEFRKRYPWFYRTIGRKCGLSKSSLNIFFSKKMCEHDERFEDEERARSYGLCEVEASDQNKAIELTISIVEEALNILRFYNNYIPFGAVGNYNPPFRYGYHIFDLKNKTNSMTSGWKNQSGGCVIERATIKELKKKAGLRTLNKIFNKREKDRTKFEKLIFNSVQWYGNSIKKTELVDNYMNIIIALESLLITRNEEKKNNLSERVSIILGRNYKERKFIRDFIKNCYNMRNDIVHDGFRNVNERKFHYLRFYLNRLLIVFLFNIKKKKDLDDWINFVERKKIT